LTFTCKARESAWCAIKFIPVPEVPIDASLRVFWFFRMIKKAHIEAANMIHVIFDIVGRTRGCAFTFVDFVSSISAHVTIYIQLMVANCTTTVTGPAEFLVISDGTFCTFASH